MISNTAVWSTFNRNFDTVIESMQNNPNIENTEINVSMDCQFSVFFLYNFTRNNCEITYILVAVKQILKTLEK